MSNTEAQVVELISGAVAPVTSEAIVIGSDMRAVQVKGITSAGVGAATVIVEVTNDTTWPWLTAATITLTLGTTAVSEGVVIDGSWKYARLRLSAISGTGATVSANIGV